MNNDWEIAQAVDAWKLKAADESFAARYETSTVEDVVDDYEEKMEHIENYVDRNCRNCKHYEWDGKYHNCFLCDLYEDGAEGDVCDSRLPVIKGEWKRGTPDKDGEYIVLFDYLALYEDINVEPVRVTYTATMHYHDGWGRYRDKDPKTILDQKIVAWCELTIPEIPVDELNIVNARWN